MKAILCANDSMALGAVAALKAAGRGRDVLVAGFDNISAVQALIKSGEIVATADQHGDQLAVFGIEYALERLRNPGAARGSGDAGRPRHGGDAPLKVRFGAGAEWAGLSSSLVLLVAGFSLSPSTFSRGRRRVALANQAPEGCCSRPA